MVPHVTCSEPDKRNQIERRILDEIVALRELEKLDPARFPDERVKFLQELPVRRIASLSVSTSSSRGDGGEVQLHFC